MRAVKLVVGIAVAAALMAWWLGGDREPDVAPPRPAPSRGASWELAPSVPETRTSAAPTDFTPLAADAPFVDVRVALHAMTPTAESRRVPVADVALELCLVQAYSRDKDTPTLARGVTDAEGVARLRAPWSAFAPHVGEQTQRMHLRLEHPSVLTSAWTASWTALPQRADEPVQLDVRVERGVHVDVQLLGPDEQPRSGFVSTHFVLDDGTPASNAGGAADSSGRARVALRKEGPQRLLATGSGARELDLHDPTSWYPEAGTGVSAPFDLRFDAPPRDPIVLHLSGPGVLRGRVLDERGAPAAALELHALAEGWRVADLRDRAPGEVERLLAAGGHLEQTVRTNREGRFEIRGLRAERYTLHAEFFIDPDVTRVALTEAPVPADGRELELRIARPHLVIQVVDADGAPYDGELERMRYGRGVVRDAWPEAPLLAVSPAVGHVDSRHWTSPFLALNEAGRARFTAEVTPGRTYLVGLLQRGRKWAPRVVEVPEGAGRIDVELPVAPAAPTGEVWLDVLDPNGEPYHSRLVVRVVDPLSGLPLVDRRNASPRSTWPLRWELPPGRYRLEVDARPELDMYHGTVWGHRELGGFEHELEVHAQDVTRVLAQLGAGARIRLAVRGRADASDRAAVLADTPELAQHPDTLEQVSMRVETRLERVGRWPTALGFPRHAFEFTSAEGLHLLSWLDLGSTETSALVTAGTYTLVATLPGGRRVEHDIELFDGVTTEVTLDFR